MSNIFNTGGTIDGFPLQGQIVVNPGTTQGDKLIYNHESSYLGQTIIATSGFLQDRFIQPTG